MITADNLTYMSYLRLQDHLTVLVDKVGRGREIADIHVALNDHPNLVGFKTPEGKVLICGEDINIFCDRVKFEYWGDDFMALPYIQDKGVEIHSNPPAFYLGVRNSEGFGVIPYSSWEQWFEGYGLDFKIRRLCRAEMLARTPVYY